MRQVNVVFEKNSRRSSRRGDCLTAETDLTGMLACLCGPVKLGRAEFFNR